MRGVGESMGTSSDANKIFKLLKDAKKEKKSLWIDQFARLFEVQVDTLRDHKHGARLFCPHCRQSGTSACYGYTDSSKTRRRYHCKSCNRHYNDYTDTLFHNRMLLRHLVPFFKMMLEGWPVRKIAEALHISPTTAHTWRHLVFGYVEKNSALFLDKLSLCDSITETSVREMKPSRKGLPEQVPTPSGTQTVQFQCDRHGHIAAELTSSDQRKHKKSYIKGQTSLHINGQPAHQSPHSRSDTLLHHSHNVQRLDASFADSYRRMRGVAQPYLYRYVLWHCYVTRMNRLIESERLRSIQLICT